MKYFPTLILCTFFLFASQKSEAQLWKKVKRSVERKLEEKVENEVDKKIEEILDPKQKKENKDPEISQSNNEPSKETPSVPDTEGTNTLWTHYDFVPGSNIIFYDDFTRESYGEFPGKWDLKHGNSEIASVATNKALLLKGGRYKTAGVSPVISTFDFTKHTTIEFDIYCGEGFWKVNSPAYIIKLWANAGLFDDKKNEDVPKPLSEIQIKEQNNVLHVTSGDFGQQISRNNLSHLNGWHHIAISVKAKKLTVYFDEHKVITIPGLGDTPTGLLIQGRQWYADDLLALRNMKIATGNTPMYNSIVKEGRFVTRGILFDSGKTTLKPHSSGVIKQMTNLLKEQQDWKFEIVGHTDSDGDSEYNLNLSLRRANAVKQALVTQGIASSRLKATGIGEKKPLNANTTPEDKAINRRVEFILLK